MTALEQAVLTAALTWAEEVTESLQTAGAEGLLAPEEMALYEAVCAYHAARGE